MPQGPGGGKGWDVSEETKREIRAFVLEQKLKYKRLASMVIESARALSYLARCAEETARRAARAGCTGSNALPCIEETLLTFERCYTSLPRAVTELVDIETSETYRWIKSLLRPTGKRIPLQQMLGSVAGEILFVDTVSEYIVSLARVKTGSGLSYDRYVAEFTFDDVKKLLAREGVKVERPEDLFKPPIFRHVMELIKTHAETAADVLSQLAVMLRREADEIKMPFE